MGQLAPRYPEVDVFPHIGGVIFLERLVTHCKIKLKLVMVLTVLNEILQENPAGRAIAKADIECRLVPDHLIAVIKTEVKGDGLAVELKTGEEKPT